MECILAQGGQRGGVFREGFFSCYISTIRPLGFILAAAAFVGRMGWIDEWMDDTRRSF